MVRKKRSLEDADKCKLIHKPGSESSCYSIMLSGGFSSVGKMVRLQLNIGPSWKKKSFGTLENRVEIQLSSGL